MRVFIPALGLWCCNVRLLMRLLHHGLRRLSVLLAAVFANFARDFLSRARHCLILLRHDNGALFEMRRRSLRVYLRRRSAVL